MYLINNLAISTVVTAPVPAASGTTVVVGAGQGARFPTSASAENPAPVVVWPVATSLDASGVGAAEIMWCVGVSVDTLTVVRAREGTTARTIVAGDQIANVFTASALTELRAGTSDHSAATTTVHGIVDTSALETAAGAALKVSTHTSASDPHGDRAYADSLTTGGTPAVRITVLGATFSPTVELAAGSSATVTWTVEETGSTSAGLAPMITMGTSATRHVDMTAVDSYGRNALGDITTFNLGFNSTDDSGDYNMGSGYNKAAQYVSGVSGVQNMTGLVRFAAANISTLAGTLDFTGLSWLQYIELYGSAIQDINLTGCTRLVRLCLESNDLATLDLNQVAANLKDLRAAVQDDGALTVSPSVVDFPQLYHWCTRDQDLSVIPLSRLTAVRQMWAWNTGQVGSFAPVSTVLDSVLMYLNSYTSADLGGLIPAGRNAIVDLHGNDLASVDLTDCVGITVLDLSENLLNTAAVDGVLAEVESWATSAGTLDLSTNAAPTSAGRADSITLTGRGWTVTVDDSSGDETGILADDFERGDVSGVASLGFGWFAVDSATADIVSGNLVRTDSSAYRQLLNPAQGVLPADYSVTVSVPGADFISGSFYGLTGRWAGGTGVRVFFAFGSTDISVGDANSWNTNNVSLSTPSFPTSWTDGNAASIDHTITMHMAGTTITIEIDGHTVCSGTCTTNATATGTAYGISGEGKNYRWHSIGTTRP